MRHETLRRFKIKKKVVKFVPCVTEYTISSFVISAEAHSYGTIILSPNAGTFRHIMNTSAR